MGRSSESLPVVQSERRLRGLLPSKREDPTEKLAFGVPSAHPVGYMSSRPFAYLAANAL